jgi:predicted phosphodiesterase
VNQQLRHGIAASFLLLLAISLQAAAQEPAKQPPAQSPLFTFAVVSDLHMSEHDGPGYFKAFVRQIDALPEKPDFVLVTGDIHVDAFAKAFGEIQPAIPFHVIAGNHENRDARDKLAKMFPNDFNDKDFYSFTHKNSCFIGLCDATTTGDHVGHFESEFIKGEQQGRWLEEQLRQNSGKVDHVFIFGHIPPSPNGNAGRSYLSTNDQKQLRELVLQYKPAALFFGHMHEKMSFKIGQSPVYVLPSLNWNSNPQSQPRSFMAVRVFKDAVATELIPLKE